MSASPLTPALSVPLSSAPATPMVQVFRPVGEAAPASSAAPANLTPAQVRHAYGFDQTSFGGVTGDGRGQTIAIVDAYDDPNIAGDLAAFDQRLGIAAPPSFKKVAEDGSTNYPAVDSAGGWELEESLDVEWAHALAPGASILLVEAGSAYSNDLDTAVSYAAHYPGVSAVSMSYGGGEYAGETSEDATFTTPSGHTGVTFLAAAGDTGGELSYPALSPNVVNVGGTVLTINSSNNYVSETAWSSGGGGISAYEAQPAYQHGVVTQSGTQRTGPDVAFDAGKPVSVYDSYSYGTTYPWVGVTGTSVATPCWAALIAVADQGRALNNLPTLDGPTGTLPQLYKLSSADFHDVTTGSNGHAAGPGYDLATGRGSPVANLVAADLAGTQPAAVATTLTWTGAGSDANWSDPSNWGGVAPVAGDTLVFGPGAAQLTTNNDLAANTAFAAIDFTGSGYVLNGNAVELTGPLDASSATGPDTVNLGLTLGGSETVKAGSGSAALTLGALNTNGYALTFAGGSGATTVAGPVSGGGSLTDSAPGVLTLSAANTYTGGTTLAAGTLALGSGSALGAGTLTASAGTLEATGGAVAVANPVTLGGNVTLGGSNAITLSGPVTLTGTRTLTVSNTGGATVSGVIGQSGGTYGLTKAGTGTLVLSGGNTYGGGTTLTAGTLSLGSASALGTGTLVLNNGGTLQATGGAVTVANPVSLVGATTIGGSDALTFSGPFTLAGGRTLVANNTATTTISGAIGQSGGSYGLVKSGTGVLVLSGSNTYTGGTTLNAGTLTLTTASALGTGTLVLNGGTLLANNPLTVANPVTLTGHATIGGTSALTFTGPVTLTGNRTLTVTNTGGTTFAGAVGQSGGSYGLTVTGTGLLVLSGNNTYTGPTTVNGNVQVTGTLAASGAVTVNSGGTLSGTGTVGAVTVGNGGTLSPGAGGGIGVLYVGNLTMNAGSALNIQVNGPVAGSGYDQLSVTGSVTLNSPALNVTFGGGYTPAVGTTYTVISNDGSDPVAGTFKNLAEGATWLSNGMTFQISYDGGTGNDVTLTRTA